MAGVEADGGEYPGCGPREDAAAERDQPVVEAPLAGEAHEVHALVVGAPVAGCVGEPDHQPQQDGQVQRREHLGVGYVGAWFERVDVDDHHGRDERRSQQGQAPRVQPALPGEVSGQERQHQQAEVACVELVEVLEFETEQLGRLDRDRGRARQRAHGDELAPGLDAAGLGRRPQPLPQPPGLLAGVLRVLLGVLCVLVDGLHPFAAGVRPLNGGLHPFAGGLHPFAAFCLVGAGHGRGRLVERAEALGGDQEGLVGGQSGIAELGDLFAKTAFETVRIGGISAPAAQLNSPLTDPCCDAASSSLSSIHTR